MQPHGSSRSSTDSIDTAITHAWQLLPETLQRVLEAGLRVVLIVTVARLLFNAVPRLQQVVVRRASSAASQTRTGPTDSQMQNHQRLETLVRVVGSIARSVVGAVGVVMLLSAVGLDVGPLLAGAGIAGVAVGFGAQSVVKDFFSGFFILLENQFDVGDEVTVNTVRGVVEEMTMRITVVRDLAGAVHYLPNGTITTVVNHDAGWARATVALTTPLAVAASDARRVLAAVVDDVRDDPQGQGVLAGSVELEGPTELGAQGIAWKVQVRARPRRLDTARELVLKALQKRVPLDERGQFAWERAAKLQGP